MTNRQIALAALVGVFAIGAAAGVFGYRWWITPKTVIVTQHDVTTVTVEKPVIVTKDVIRYFEDQTEVSKLLAENTQAKQQIAVLTETVGRLEAQGGGTVVFEGSPEPGTAPWRFTDFRLDGKYAFGSFNYQLHQQFEVLTTVGRDRTGAPVASVRLFEIGPGAWRTPLTDLKTTVVAATPLAPRWRLGMAVQAGVGLMANGIANQPSGVGVVGLAWLRRGTGTAAEDNRWAVATPLFIIGKGMTDVAIAPVSVNLGHKVVRDLWLSPAIGLHHSFGVTLTATF